MATRSGDNTGMDAAVQAYIDAIAPELRTSTGTIQVRPADAARVTDEDFRALLCATLDD
jgi:hypothetical protein